MTDTVAHHLLKAQIEHNTVRAQRNLLLAALKELLRNNARPISKPIGAPYSPARLDWQGKVLAYGDAERAIVLCEKENPNAGQ